MKTKLLAATLCTLALAACDFEQRPDSAADQSGPGVNRTAPGAAPMTPATPPASGASPAVPPAGESRS